MTAKKKKTASQKKKSSVQPKAVHDSQELLAREKELAKELQRVREAMVGAPAADEVNHHINVLHRAAQIMEKSRIQDYMMLVDRPLRMIWVNLLAGLGRGVGFFFGTVMLSLILLFVLGQFLGWIYEDVGGLPFVGHHMQAFITWMLELIHQAESVRSITQGGQ